MPWPAHTYWIANFPSGAHDEMPMVELIILVPTRFLLFAVPTNESPKSHSV